MFEYEVTPASLPCGVAGAALTVKVSNETGAAQDSAGIQFTLPAGLSDDLGLVLASPLSGTPWAIPAQGDGVFIAEPQPPATGIGAGDAIGFVFSNITVSDVAATVDLEIEEAAGGTFKLPIRLDQAQLGIAQFTATAVEVTPGSPVTLSWNASAATGCSLAWSSGRYDGASSDSYTDHPATSTTYTLTASGQGEPVWAQLTVTVQTPKVLSFGASASEIAQGTPVSLAWETIHAATCTLTFYPGTGPAPPPLGVPMSSTDYVVYPPSSGTYHLEAVGEGRTVSSDQPVAVQPVSIQTFTATPSTIAPGAAATLAWSTEWASGCQVEPGLGPVQTSWQTPVSPAADTMYTLTAAGGGGPVLAYAKVALIPMLCDFVFCFGQGWEQLQWVSDATTATLTGVGAVPPSGVRLSLTSGTLTLSGATGATAAIEFSLTTTQEQAGPGIVRLDANSPGLNLPGGDQTVTWLDQGDSSIEGSVATSAAGTIASLGPDPQSNYQFELGEPAAGASWLWNGSVAGGAGTWRFDWTVLANQPPAN